MQDGVGVGLKSICCVLKARGYDHMVVSAWWLEIPDGLPTTRSGHTPHVSHTFHMAALLAWPVTQHSLTCYSIGHPTHHPPKSCPLTILPTYACCFWVTWTEFTCEQLRPYMFLHMVTTPLPSTWHTIHVCAPQSSNKSSMWYFAYTNPEC